MIRVRERSTHELTPGDLRSLRDLFDAAWTDEGDAFTDDDFEHTCGGVHFSVETGGAVVSHASVVERVLETAGQRLRTGYVEGVATLPGHRRRGYASAIMERVAEHIDRTFDLGALRTGLHAFYERLGWVVWRGPTAVRNDRGIVPTPEEDGFIMVHLTPRSPALDLSVPISCEWRSGDVW